jgi:hypothetical protein
MMGLSKERQRDQRAHALISSAMDALDWPASTIPEFTEKRISLGKCHEKLTAGGIEAGVTAFIVLNNLNGGSVGDVQLFRLLKKYLLDKESRRAINEAMLEGER